MKVVKKNNKRKSVTKKKKRDELQEEDLMIKELNLSDDETDTDELDVLDGQLDEENKKGKKNKRVKKEKKPRKRKTKDEYGNKKKRSFWKKLLTIIILCCIVGIFAVFAFCIYIVASTGDFDPNALANKDRTIVYDSAGNEIATLGMENRESVTYDKLPEVLIDAIIATEDSRFFQHNGVDTARFVKAALLQVLGNHSAGGASTLTMQVVKNNLTSTEQTIIRKFKDVYLAVFFMEDKYSKEEILEFYVNDSCLGGNIYGVEEASKYYFGKSVSDLTLPEAALIAGLFQAPSKYNPYNNPEGAQARRSTVLKLMVRHGYITKEEADIANSIDVSKMLVGKNSESNKYQSYIDSVIEEIEDKNDESPYLVPMKIYTNLDTKLQDGMNAIMSGEDFDWIDDYVQAGVSIVDVKTGKLVAIGGGRNRTGERQWNYATQSYRQPGSTAKPLFAYGPGFEYENFSTGEIFVDEAWSYSDGTPFNNWDGGYQGVMTLRNALAVSRNVPAIKAFQRVGAKNVAAFVEGLGIPLKDHVAYEAYAIGGLDKGVTPTQMAGAYAAFANGGYFTEPYTVSKIVYRETGEEKDMTPETSRAMKDSTAYLVTNVLEYAAHYGFSGGTSGYRGTVAVKTGTSNYSESIMQKYGLPSYAVNDLWSVAYTPQYSIAVWYGYDEVNSEHYNTSGSYKDSLVAAVMRYIPVTNEAFTMPGSVVSSSYEKDTFPAMLPSENTPADLVATEYFVKGAQPTETSPRFAKFSDVSNLKAKEGNGSVTLTWDAETPEILSDDYLKKYFSQVVYGHSTDMFVSDWQNYAGGYGYGIYIKENNGNLTKVDFTKNKTYTYKGKANGQITFVVKAQYKEYENNASTGKTIKASINGIKDDVLSVTLKGNSSVTHATGSSYTDSGITVLFNDNEVTDYTISYSITNSDGSVTAVPTTSALEDNIGKLETGTYTIKYIVTYNDQSKSVTRKIIIQ